ACLFVDDVLSAHLSDQFVLIDRQVDNARLAELLDACPSELGVLSHQDLALVLDVARGTLTLKEVEFDALFCAFTFTQGDGFSVVEILKQVLNAVTESPQQHGGVHLPAPIDPDVDDVLVVKLKVEP